MIEKECKFWPIDRARLYNALCEITEPEFSTILRNSYFTFPAAKPDSLFRIRSIGRQAILGAKGPRAGGSVKVREEYECLVSKRSVASDLLVVAGAKSMARTEERWRAQWALPDGVTVCIDRLPDLRIPDYAEIEVHEIKQITVWAAKLGLNRKGVNRSSNTFEELAALHGVSFNELLVPLPRKVRKSWKRIEPQGGFSQSFGDVTRFEKWSLNGREIVVESSGDMVVASCMGVSLQLQGLSQFRGFLTLCGAEPVQRER